MPGDHSSKPICLVPNQRPRILRRGEAYRARRCLGWSTHSLAPLSFRSASYSGVFTLFPLLSGIGRARHGEILREAVALADAGRLKPLLNDQRFSTANIAAAHALVESGALGKVVVEF
jgi:NADPH:quinone reductase